MRALLMSMMFILVILAIYASIADGDDGMKQGIGRSGSAMSDYIKGMSP
ncbi:hypothetical protein [Paenibacillus sp. HB172176]|nr:hypothetical protein [Paenibacillus sp. HB172176]